MTLELGQLVHSITPHGVLWGRVDGFSNKAHGFCTATTYCTPHSVWWSRENVEIASTRQADPTRDTIPDYVLAAHTAWLITGGQA